MAKAKNVLGFAPFKEVIQVTLWDSFEDDVEVYLSESEDVQGAFLGLAANGYSVTLEPAPEGGFTTKLRVLDRKSQNAGLMFFSSGPSEIEVMAITVVKEHFLGRESDWTSKASSITTKKWR